MPPVLQNLRLRMGDLAPTLRNRAIAGTCGLAALVAGHYVVLHLTTCYTVPPGILVLVTCSWPPRAVGFVLLAVLTLGIPFLLGLRRGEWWTGVLPPLGYFLALVLWQATRGQRLSYDLAYDLSPVEFLVFRVAIYWALMVFAFTMGRALR